MNVRNFIKLLIILIIITTPAFCQVSEVVSGGGSSEWTASGSTQIYTEKSVGIGTSTPDPAYKCYIDGDTKIDNGKLVLNGPNNCNNYIENVNNSGRDNLYIYGDKGLSSEAYLEIGNYQVYCSPKLQASEMDSNNIKTRGIYGYLDSDTSIEWYTCGGALANQLLFKNGGVETMRLTENNNMLVGTKVDDGVHKLQVSGSAYISDTLKLEPIAEPSNPTEGMIYQSSADHHLYVYNGTAWKQLDN